jgi:prolyl oligopeptidase PreP (S9A serine peptidase family)
VDTYFDATAAASYQWMENVESPALQQSVEAENTLTSSYLDGSRSGVESSRS